MKKLIKKWLIPISLILISFVILLVKAKYSFCWSDESFYSATTSRFYNGDSIFKDEWFPTQLSSVALLPLYSLYVLITKSTTGILLYFRVLFVIFETISAFIVFGIIKKNHGSYIGLAAALITQWYTHLNIATLSYYTITLHCSLLAMLIIYDCYMDTLRVRPLDSGYIEMKKSPSKLIVAGILFAIAVLCLPTLVIPYFAVIFGGFLLTILAKPCNKSEAYVQFVNNLDFIYVFKWTFTGILVPAVIFFAYLLSNVAISDFIKAIPYVLSDDEHTTSFLYPIKKMYLAIEESFGSIAKLCYLFTAMAILFFLLILLKKYSKSDKIKELTSSIIRAGKPIMFIADIVLFILYFTKCYGYTGYILTAIMMFSLPLFLITERKNYYLFILTFCYGIIYALVYSYSSFGMLYVLAMGHFFAAISGIILSYEFILEVKNDFPSFNKVFSLIYILVVASSVLLTMALRITNIYRDDSLDNLTSKIDAGPAKGLYTSMEHYSQYMDVLETINTYCMSTSKEGNKNLIISKLLPYGYLISDLRVASPTVWRNPMDSERVEEYYQINPDKKPDVIFVINEEYGSYETCGDVESDPRPNENAKEGFLYDYIEANNFYAIPVPCGTIYQKP